jgi:hypothetical protein
MLKILLGSSFILLLFIFTVSAVAVSPENYPIDLKPNDIKEISFRACPTPNENIDYNKLTFGIQFTRIDKDGNIWYYPQGGLGLGFPKAIYLNNNTCTDIPLTITVPNNYTPISIRVKLLPVIKNPDGTMKPLYNQTEIVRVSASQAPTGLSNLTTTNPTTNTTTKYNYTKIFILIILFIIVAGILYWFYNNREEDPDGF